MTNVNSISEVIDKLNKLVLTNKDGDKVKAHDTSGNEYVISYRTKLSTHTVMIAKQPITLSIHVSVNGSSAFSWGCVDTEEIAQFVLWFVRAQGIAFERNYDAKEGNRRIAEGIFESL